MNDGSIIVVNLRVTARENARNHVIHMGPRAAVAYAMAAVLDAQPGSLSEQLAAEYADAVLAEPAVIDAVAR